MDTAQQGEIWKHPAIIIDSDGEAESGNRRVAH